MKDNTQDLVKLTFRPLADDVPVAIRLRRLLKHVLVVKNRPTRAGALAPFGESWCVSTRVLTHHGSPQIEIQSGDWRDTYTSV